MSDKVEIKDLRGSSLPLFPKRNFTGRIKERVTKEQNGME
jgi:hypothetical protein